MVDKIPFNKPYLAGNELIYIGQAIASGKISGGGIFTRKCHSYFQERYMFKKCLLTTSCTDALEMAAILIGIEPGDEVIMPSYTFVSTATAFVLRGAKIHFVDSRLDHPGIDENAIEAQITPKTKAIVVVHYAGFACDMDKIMGLANKYHLFVIEDAAQAVDAYYKGIPLGSIGHLAAFSFHETKNIISGEGGMLVVNDIRFMERAELIWEKGTNRSSFFRGEIDKYNWVDVGSSFLPSEMIAAFLYAQLENLDGIQLKRGQIWNTYHDAFSSAVNRNLFQMPKPNSYSSNNYHMFYLVCNSAEDRVKLISFLKDRGISAVFHYQSLHSSPYYKNSHDGRHLRNSDFYSDCLVRLPFYYELEPIDQKYIIDSILNFYGH